MKYFLLNVSVVASLALAIPAFAADEKKADDKKPAEAAAPAVNPYREQINAMARELAKEFGKDHAQALAQIRNGFGMLRAVKLVERDVGKAVDACGKANPDIGKDMKDRFGKWSGSVNPLIKKQQGAMDDAIHAAAFPDEKKVKSYLDLIDKAAEFADSQIEKNALTTPEACGNLRASMESTEPTMVDLLGGIKWAWTPPAETEKPASAGRSE